jgi:hypothetical protein
MKAMLIQAWERLRGYDRWTPATATVKSSSLARVEFDRRETGDAKKPAFAWKSNCTIVWNDQNGVERKAVFEAFEESPLYQLVDGDQVAIRFNPHQPAEFYLPGLLHSKLAQAWKMGVFALLIILVIFAILAAWFGPNLLNAFSH